MLLSYTVVIIPTLSLNTCLCIRRSDVKIYSIFNKLFISSNYLSQILKCNSIPSSLKARAISIFHDSEFKDNADSQKDKVEDDQRNSIDLGRPELQEGHDDKGETETDAQSSR